MKKKLFASALAAAALALAFGGCAASADLTEYVSEYRSDIYEGTSGGYSVFASFSQREYPYEADGNAGEMSDLFEAALSAPDNTKTYILTFSVGGTEYEEELSFDSVRMVHTFSRSLPCPTEKEIVFSVTDTEGAEPGEREERKGNIAFRPALLPLFGRTGKVCRARGRQELCGRTVCAPAA